MIGGAALAAGVVGLAIYGSSQLMRPRPTEHRDDPAAWGLDCEEVEFPAADGARVPGWLARGSGQAAVIVVHGHGQNRHGSLPFASFLYPRFTVLLPDLRGHGDSEGRHTSVGFHERQDVLGAVTFLNRMGYGPIGVLGISMGGVAAMLAAAETPLIRAVVTDSSFATLHGAIREAARLRGYPGPITGPLAWLSCRTAALRLRHPYGAGDPVRCVAGLAPRPLLIIHGEEDALVRPAHAHALFAAAGGSKELWMLPGVAHAQALDMVGDAYRERVGAFFGRWLLDRSTNGEIG